MFCFSGTATVIAILKGERGGGGNNTILKF